MRFKLPTINTVGWIIIGLLVLWAIGARNINIPNFTFFHLNGHPITLWNILTFALSVWLLKILPSPFREIIALLLVLWLLSIFGFFVFGGLAHLILLVFVVVLLFSLL